MEYNFETIKTLIADFKFNEEFDMVVAVANGGIIPAAMINQRLAVEFATLRISLRDSSHKPIYDTPQVVGDLPHVKGKRVLLVEDRVKSGASLSRAKEILEAEGAALVRTFAVNGKADYPLLDVTCFKFPWIL